MTVTTQELTDIDSLERVKREYEGMVSIETAFETLPLSDFLIYVICHRDHIDSLITRLQEAKKNLRSDNGNFGGTTAYIQLVNTGSRIDYMSENEKQAIIGNLRDTYLPARIQVKTNELNSFRDSINTFVLTVADATNFGVGNEIHQTTGTTAEARITAISSNDITVYIITGRFVTTETVVDQTSAASSTISSIA